MCSAVALVYNEISLSALSYFSCLGRKVVKAHTRNDISGHIQGLEFVFFQFPWEALLRTILLPSFPWVVLCQCFVTRADFCVIKPWLIDLLCFRPSFFFFNFPSFSSLPPFSLFSGWILWLLALIVNLIQSSLQAGKKSLRGCLDQLGLKARLRSGCLD